MKQFSLFISLLSTYFIHVDFLYVLAVHRAHSSEVTKQGRIEGGTDVPKEALYQVALLMEIGDNKERCAGAIVSQNFVLTSAICVDSASEAFIRAGSLEFGSGGKTYTSTDLRRHPAYDPTNGDFDIALIGVEKGIEIDNKSTKIVNLPALGDEFYYHVGQVLSVSGWGKTSYHGDVSDVLKAVNVTILSKKNCRVDHGLKTTSTQFCAGDSMHGSCKGDSGGPAVYEADNLLRGVVSYRLNCVQKGVPGVFTSVAMSTIRGWIKTQLKIPSKNHI